jgi:hypothetical protein
MQDAVRRRVGQELGAQVSGIIVLLPDFRYQALDASGIRENEVCPVLIAQLEGTMDPDPGEVLEHRWVDPGALTPIAARAVAAQSVQIGLLDLSHLAAANDGMAAIWSGARPGVTGNPSGRSRTAIGSSHPDLRSDHEPNPCNDRRLGG